MILPSGAYIQFRKIGTHAKFGHTIFVVDFWPSEAEFKTGKPGVRWDATLQWNGTHPDPLSRLIRHLDAQAPHALAAALPGRPHFNAGILADMAGKPDPHGNLAHPSIKAIEVVPL